MTAGSSSSRAISRAPCDAGHIAPTLQAALDDWASAWRRARAAADALEADAAATTFRFREGTAPRRCRAPINGRTGSAYVNHVELVRKARGAEMPDAFWTDPLMYQGGSDAFSGRATRFRCRARSLGLDLEAEVAVVTDDVPMGVTPEEARAAHQACHARQRRDLARPCRQNSQRDLASFSRSRPPPFRRSP